MSALHGFHPLLIGDIPSDKKVSGCQHYVGFHTLLIGDIPTPCQKARYNPHDNNFSSYYKHGYIGHSQITAKGAKPQSELLTAITLDYQDYYYMGMTLDLISESKLSVEEERLMMEQLEELKRLRDDTLNLDQERIEFLEEQEKLFLLKKARQVCMGMGIFIIHI